MELLRVDLHLSTDDQQQKLAFFDSGLLIQSVRDFFGVRNTFSGAGGDDAMLRQLTDLLWLRDQLCSQTECS